MRSQNTNATKYENLAELKDGPFRRLTGVSRSVFSLMVEILTVDDGRKKAKGGRESKLCIEDRLLMALEYLREYRTYFHIGQNYGVSESYAYKICKWVEDTLILPKQQEPGIFLCKIICTDFTNGKRHDFRLLKESKLKLHPSLKLQTDTGYAGILKLHANSELPKKRSKKHPLTKEDTQNNRRIARERVDNEHVIGALKRFKIIADKYRNRRKRFGLRFNLIAGIYNLERF